MENSTHADDSGLLQILHGLQTFPMCTTKPTGSSHVNGHVITSGGDNMGFKENGLEIVEDKKRRRVELFFSGHSYSMAIDSGEQAIVSQVAGAANRVLETSSTIDISLAGPAQVEKLKSKLGLKVYSQSHIDMEVSKEDGLRWRVTGFYGFPDRSQQHLSWNLLRSLYSASSFPWCCLGDFNDIVCNEEKRGNVPHPPWLIRGFCEALSDSQLQDLPLKGYHFTWEKGRGSSHWVEECLDRALVNVSWLNLFSNAKLNNLVAPISDHSPIELVTVDKFSFVYKHRFWFENGWLKEDGLDFVVSNAWRSPHAVNLIDKIHTCSFALKECIDQYRDKDGPTDSQVLKAYKTALSNVLMQEEFFWKHRAKSHWL
ncbi:hypothetical protein AAG906_010144 [Vitis piasezkii]